MKTKKRRAHPFLPYLYALVFVAVAVPGYIAYSHREKADDVSYLGTEALAPETRAAAGAEAAFQALPEPAHAPNALKIPIFIYHSVRPHIQGENAENEAYDITPELLDEELTYLDENGFTPISMDEFKRYVEQGYSPALKPVVLTFDDGWRNQYTYAFPLLEKHHMTAVFYIYTNPIDHEKPHFLSWDEVREMDKAGMQIASHTVTHPLLYRLGPDAVLAEMSKSKARIEAELGHPITHFASPFGSTNDLIVATAKVVGYSTVRTTLKGSYHTKDDLLSLRGILVDDNLADFVKVLKTN